MPNATWVVERDARVSVYLHQMDSTRRQFLIGSACLLAAPAWRKLSPPLYGWVFWHGPFAKKDTTGGPDASWGFTSCCTWKVFRSAEEEQWLMDYNGQDLGPNLLTLRRVLLPHDIPDRLLSGTTIRVRDYCFGPYWEATRYRVEHRHGTASQRVNCPGVIPLFV